METELGKTSGEEMNSKSSSNNESENEFGDMNSENWESEFLKVFPEKEVVLIQDAPKQGPDGWPYMLVRTKPKEGEKKEPVTEVISWLSERGIGLTVNPQKKMPDYVFTYGMIWSYRAFGRFLGPRIDTAFMATELGQDLICGEPTEELLPSFARKILKQFFNDQSVLNPRCLIVSRGTNQESPGQNSKEESTAPDEAQFDFCFSLESLGNPPKEEHEGIAEAISWFLPPNYPIVLATEKGLPKFSSL